MNVPPFTLAGYTQLLQQLRDLGYGFAPATPVDLIIARDRQQRTVLLRHDVDFHVRHLEQIADTEYEQGADCRSAWFIRPDGPYNPGHEPNRRTIRHLHDTGHRLGVHYDVQRAASSPEPRRELEAWVTQLEDATNVPFTSAAPHRPTAGPPDPLGDHGYVISKDVPYVSDSCRRWRTDVPLPIFDVDNAVPPIFVLNCHPEWWLTDGGVSRDEHLQAVLRRMTYDSRACVMDEYQSWASHPSATQQAA